MPGPGTDPADTGAEIGAVCLDVTRLVSRVTLTAPTGIDRVERAYLDHCLTLETSVFGLCRLATGLCLLNRAGLSALAKRLNGSVAWGRPDMAARLSRSLDPRRRAAEADVRRLSAARAVRGLGDNRLTRRLPEGTLYLNVGHANLTEATMRALRQVESVKIAVLVHDTIPLDFPRYQRPGTVARFEERLSAVARHADLVIASSVAAAEPIETHLGRLGRVPGIVVAPLGVTVPVPDSAALPEGLPPSSPYFVALGTIEPRKNHALLLDMWEAMAVEDADACPALAIVGRRGWNNRDVFDRLDRTPLRGQRIVEVADLADDAVAALLIGSAGLLFPSFAEGYGLPPLEAAALGVPVLAAPLPVLRETLGNIPVYADPTDLYDWISKTRRLASRNAETGKQGRRAGIGPTGIPTWQDHFKIVFTELC